MRSRMRTPSRCYEFKWRDTAAPAAAAPAARVIVQQEPAHPPIVVVQLQPVAAAAAPVVIEVPAAPIIGKSGVVIKQASAARNAKRAARAADKRAALTARIAARAAAAAAPPSAPAVEEGEVIVEEEAPMLVVDDSDGGRSPRVQGVGDVDVELHRARERAETQKLLAEAVLLRAQAAALMAGRNPSLNSGGFSGGFSGDALVALLAAFRQPGATPVMQQPAPAAPVFVAEVQGEGGRSLDGFPMSVLSTLKDLPPHIFVERFRLTSAEYDAMSKGEREVEKVTRDGFTSDNYVHEHDGMRMRFLAVDVYAQRSQARVPELNDARWAMLNRPPADLLLEHPEWKLVAPPVVTMEQRDLAARGDLKDPRPRYALSGSALNAYISTLSSLLRHLVKELLGRDMPDTQDVDPTVLFDLPADNTAVQTAFDGWLARIESQRVAKATKAGKKLDNNISLTGPGNNVYQALHMTFYPHSEALEPIQRIIRMAWSLRGANNEKDRARAHGKLAGRVRQNMVPWSTIVHDGGEYIDRALEAFKAHMATNDDMQRAAWLSAYIDMPPLRGGGNYGVMRLLNHRPSEAEQAALPERVNALYADGGRYHRLMRWYKNKRSMGVQVLEVDTVSPKLAADPSRFKELLDTLIEMRTDGMNGHLFVDLGKYGKTRAGPSSVPADLPALAAGKKKAADLLPSIMKAALVEDVYSKRRVTFQVLRVSHNTAIFPSLDDDEIVTNARLMLHSVEKARTYVKQMREKPTGRAKLLADLMSSFE